MGETMDGYVTEINEHCIHCGACRQYCPEDAIRSRNGRMQIIRERCTDCGKCIKACYVRAIRKREIR
jgi:ferredoxin